MDDIIETTAVATTTELLAPEEQTIAPAQALTSEQNYLEQLTRWRTLHGSGALPMHIQNAEQAIAIAAMGAELGWSPMKSVRSIYLVKGNPQLSAQAMLGLVYERMPSVSIDIIQNDAEAAKVRARRNPDDSWSEFSFTIEEAKRAGLLTKKGDTWRSYAADMLWARCVSRMCRRKFPDVVQGCYVAGELEAAQEEKPRPKRGQVNEAASALLLGQASEEGGGE